MAKSSRSFSGLLGAVCVLVLGGLADSRGCESDLKLISRSERVVRRRIVRGMGGAVLQDRYAQAIFPDFVVPVMKLKEAREGAGDFQARFDEAQHLVTSAILRGAGIPLPDVYPVNLNSVSAEERIRAAEWIAEEFTALETLENISKKPWYGKSEREQIKYKTDHRMSYADEIPLDRKKLADWIETQVSEKVGAH